MRVAVTGASGLIGSVLVPALRADGHDAVRLVRRQPSGADEIQWDPAAHRLDPTALADVDAVIHLAGVGIARFPWTERHRRSVMDSRVDGTETVAEALASAPPRERVLVSASAVGWYGDAGDRAVVESDGPGTGFLADVCRAWEGATAAAAPVARVVTLRTGLVLTRRGGLLQRMLPIFRAGLGGRLGNGGQYWPWISLPDEIRAIRHLLAHAEVRGPVNLTGPTPVTNAEFTTTLGRVLHRPTLAPVPGVAIRLALGGFGTEGVLAGQRALPRVLESTGFAWEHPTLEAALRAALAAPHA